jgi:glycosyltransferase involved in cell wall biosynthesis
LPPGRREPWNYLGVLGVFAVKGLTAWGMPMKIVMDFRKYDGVIGGVERGVLEISKYVAANGHYVVLLCKEKKCSEVEGLFSGIPNIAIVPLQVPTHAMSLQNARLDSGLIQDIAEREGADVIHFPYNWSFPFSKKVPTILTIHDVIPFTFREAMGFWRNHLLYKPGIRQAGRLNNVIATVSEFSKRDIAEQVGVPLSKIRVIPNGLRETFPPDAAVAARLSERLGLQDGFILNVGGIHERKNVVTLIHAFSSLVKHKGYPGKLVVTGSVSGAPYQVKMKKLVDAAVTETEMGDRVKFTGFIPDEELDSLFRSAAFMIYPSLYEGFGIPILEAMKLGTPVITSNLTAMPEVAGGAALLVDPRDIEDMVSAMERLLSDESLREELIQKGQQRASSYSWGRTSEEYLELYREVSASVVG